MFRVWKSDEGKSIFLPVLGESRPALWTHHQYHGFPLLKLIKVPAQLRHVRAAVWSQEASVEDQQDIPATKIRKPD